MLANVRWSAGLGSGLPAGWGIKDYDIAYFDADVSWEAEDRVITRVQQACAQRQGQRGDMEQRAVHGTSPAAALGGA